MLNHNKINNTLLDELEHLRRENAELKEKLQQQEDMQYLLARIVEHLPNPIVVTDFDGKIIYVNKSVESHYGYSRTELINEPVIILNGEDNAREVQEEIFEYLCSHEVWNKEIIQRRKDGSNYLGDFKIFNVFDSENNVIALASVQQDITKRKQAEDALQKQVQFLQTLIDTIPNPIYYKDTNGLFQGCNRAFELDIGCSRERIMGKSVYDLCIRELADIYTEKDSQLLDTKGVQVYETLIPYSDGNMHNVFLHKGVFKDSNGYPAGVVGVVIDITERKRMENALRESEEKYRELFENANDIIYTSDLKGNFTSVNRTALETYGYSTGEFVKMKIEDILDYNYVATGFKNLDKKLRGIEEKTGPYEVLTYTKSGVPVWVEVSTRLIKKEGIPVGVQGIARNITERKKMQQEIIMKSEMLDAAMDSIIAHDINGNVLYSNEVGYKSRGYDENEFMQMNLLDLEHPDYPKNIDEIIEILLKEGKHFFHTVDLHKDGKIIPVEVNSRLINVDGKNIILSVVRDISERKKAEAALKKSEALYRTIFENTGTATMINEEDTTIELVNTEFELLSGYSKDEIEGKMFWQDFFVEEEREQLLKYHNMRLNNIDNPPRKYETSFVDRYGNVKNVLMTLAVIPNTRKHVASLLDITEIKMFQREMIRFEQLNLIGQMAAGIAHEVRNPMTTVRGFLQIFEDKKELINYKSHFNLMIEELDRANSIITQFLSLAKNKTVEKTKINLNSLIMKLSPLLQAEVFKYNMYTKYELNNIPDLLLDEKEIKQLVLNLVHNALEEMEPGKMLTINTFTEDEEVILAIIDQGKGIAPDVLDKLGTPFLTTKDEGTGLGLAVCYSIAARHKAVIDVKTGPEGTTFFVRFKIFS